VLEQRRSTGVELKIEAVETMPHLGIGKNGCIEATFNRFCRTILHAHLDRMGLEACIKKLPEHSSTDAPEVATAKKPLNSS